jgi:hypothetical protein
MDIRCNQESYKKIYKLWEKTTAINKELVTLNIDEKVKVPVIVVKDDKGNITEWTRGFDNVKSFIKYGYVRIIKKCPYQFGKCRGEKCQLYQVINGTGDCSHSWNAIGLWNK